MSRFLFTAIGSLGDLHPYIAVACALNERGHEGVIGSAEEYRAPVEAAGVRFVPMGPSQAEMGDYRALVTRVFHPRRGMEFLIRRLVMPNLRRAYDDLLRASESADLLVSHPLAFTVPLVAERRGLPWAGTVLAPINFLSACDPPLLGPAPWMRRLGPGPNRWLLRLVKRVVWRWEAPLRDLRAELGLPPQRHSAVFEGQFSPWLNLALFDPPLARPQPDWPPHTRVCGAAVYDGAPPDPALLAEVERFLEAGEAPVVFALGSSAVWIAGGFWKHAVGAVRRLGRRALMVTGPDQPEGLPEGVRAFPYLPYSQVFPRAAAVVHQAGIGTLAQAMRAGRPQLIVPVAFDQPDNARRAAALGLGRVLPFRKVTARRLAAELEPLLADPAYAHAAEALARDLAKVDGAACAADLLIACLRQA